MKTTMFVGFLVLVAASGCASASDDESLQSSSAELAATVGVPRPPPVPLQCASVSVAPCVGSTLGGACAADNGGPGVCASVQTPAQWIPAGPGVATAGWDCNLCVFAPPIPNPRPPADSYATIPRD